MALIMLVSRQAAFCHSDTKACCHVCKHMCMQNSAHTHTHTHALQSSHMCTPAFLRYSCICNPQFYTSITVLRRIGHFHM